MCRWYIYALACVAGWLAHIEGTVIFRDGVCHVEDEQIYKIKPHARTYIRRAHISQLCGVGDAMIGSGGVSQPNAYDTCIDEIQRDGAIRVCGSRVDTILGAGITHLAQGAYVWQVKRRGNIGINNAQCDDIDITGTCGAEQSSLRNIQCLNGRIRCYNCTGGDTYWTNIGADITNTSVLRLVVDYTKPYLWDNRPSMNRSIQIGGAAAMQYARFTNRDADDVFYSLRKLPEQQSPALQQSYSEPAALCRYDSSHALQTVKRAVAAHMSRISHIDIHTDENMTPRVLPHVRVMSPQNTVTITCYGGSGQVTTDTPSSVFVHNADVTSL